MYFTNFVGGPRLDVNGVRSRVTMVIISVGILNTPFTTRPRPRNRGCPGTSPQMLQKDLHLLRVPICLSVYLKLSA